MSVGIRHDDLRRRNRAMVISAVRRAGQPSRTEIAGTTGLSHSTISAISSDLIDEGILDESKAAKAGSLKRGRPQVAIASTRKPRRSSTVVLSLNFLSVAVIDYAGQLIAEEQRRLRRSDLPRDELIGECDRHRAASLDDPDRRCGRRVMRIVMAIQGITDSDVRAMLWSPITPHDRHCLRRHAGGRDSAFRPPSRTTAT